MGSVKRILVTGASGFLGSHICEAAHHAGFEVHALVRKTSSLRWLEHPWIKIHVGDLFDAKSLSPVLKKVDAVVHNAGSLWGDYYRVNAQGTKIIAQESVKAGVKQFVFISSIAAGGPSDGPYPRDESLPDAPITPYGKSKKAAERYLHSLGNRLNKVILRFPMVYGPRDTQALRLFKTFKIFINPSIGLRRRYISAIYVKDAARAAVAALQNNSQSRTYYNISDGFPYTFSRLYKVVGKVWRRYALRLPVPFALIRFGAWVINDVLGAKTAFNPDQMRMFQRRYWLISPARAIRELGWEPRYDVYQGVAETIRWYKNQGWL